MSGIYIPNMEIPKDGYKQLFLTAEGEIIWFPTSPHDEDIKRKVVQVPDHGDLIERETLKNECKENAKRGIGLWVDYMDISLAPTIIPANKEENYA